MGKGRIQQLDSARLQLISYAKNANIVGAAISSFFRSPLDGHIHTIHTLRHTLLPSLIYLIRLALFTLLYLILPLLNEYKPTHPFILSPHPLAHPFTLFYHSTRSISLYRSPVPHSLHRSTRDTRGFCPYEIAETRILHP